MAAVNHSSVDGPALLTDADFRNSWCADLLIALHCAATLHMRQSSCVSVHAFQTLMNPVMQLRTPQCHVTYDDQADSSSPQKCVNQHRCSFIPSVRPACTKSSDGPIFK